MIPTSFLIFIVYNNNSSYNAQIAINVLLFLQFIAYYYKYLRMYSKSCYTIIVQNCLTSMYLNCTRLFCKCASVQYFQIKFDQIQYHSFIISLLCACTCMASCGIWLVKIQSLLWKVLFSRNKSWHFHKISHVISTRNFCKTWNFHITSHGITCNIHGCGHIYCYPGETHEKP